MNRTDRLLAMLLELQARRWVRAEDLAATFEVSKRTIYRDILALGASGIPVVSVPGRGYSLLEGYFLPPLNFSSDEAIMLLLGSEVVAQSFDTEYRQAAQAAHRKIEAVLPEGRRLEVDDLKSSIGLYPRAGPSQPETLQRLRQAILRRRTVRFRYRARGGHEGTRDADPYALLHIGGAWLLVAYCHLRRARRHFRLGRMADVAILDKGFTRPADFTLELSEQGDRIVLVRALFDPGVACRVQEEPSGYQVAEEEDANGLLVTLALRHPDDALSWLLGWGAHVRVLEPESLRERLALEAEGILKHYRT